MASFTNEAGWDRALRVLVGIVLLTLAWTAVAGGTPRLVLTLVGGLALATGVVGWCPAYTLFGVRTCKPPAGA